MKNIYKKTLLTLSLLTLLCYKPIFAQETMLVPVGQTVGVTLSLDGVAVAETSAVSSYDGKVYTPAADAGIKSGDIIKKINGRSASSAAELEETVSAGGGESIRIEYITDGKSKETDVQPVLSAEDGRYRLGVWVKDGVSGIGTITYYDPQNKNFGALGHEISDLSDSAVQIIGGEILNADIVSVQKGTRGCPGELIGVFREGEEVLGTVNANTSIGLKGRMNDNFRPTEEAIPVASKEEITEGAAEILADIHDGEAERFSVEIEKINKNASGSKEMIIKVTDDALLERTGGIVRGMSGSPIIQNGKLVGAVTHVLINDPTRGYGIFMESMLK